MLLVVDVGNTHTVIGIFEEQALLRDWRIHTEPAMTADEFHLLVSGLFDQAGRQLDGIEKTVVSCVVPPLVNMIDAFCRKHIGHPPLWISAQNVDMPILYDNPAEVGADRLVNAVAAYQKYATSLIVIDFGTATTFDVISEKGEYIGGAIAPGIGIVAEALFSRASKLPRVEFQPPPQVIGTNTADSMKSGILFGYAELVDGMVRRIQSQLKPAVPKVIATGGMAAVMRDISQAIESVEPELTLEGLRMISEQSK
ncbi:MAG: type III pantothenate kinase [Desulfobacterales bacterium]|nr:type III pantothenate kinase [Desulfobacterales bacterium]